MCGIAGILSFKGISIPFQKIQLMTRAMRHRGPDDEGFAFFDSKNHKYNIFGGADTPTNVFKSSLSFTPNIQFEGNLPPDTVLAFGHRRLSIIDLSPAGHQPMCTKDGRYWIVYNGEIYNFLEIRRELKKYGEYFISNTDTEVILKAYRLWGPECLNKFNGMWAFAIWDNKEKVLFCSRDRIGIKPFYYYLSNDFFLFASDIKTLIASNIYKPEPNWEGVYHAMSLQCAPRPMTCFKGVKALEQAHWMTIDLCKRMQKKRYWRIPVGEIDYNKTEDQWRDELEYTLRQAVKRRLIADVPVGTFMSGGIDSTTISAIASREHPGIKAFTLSYKNTAPEMDELSNAVATATMWSMEHIFEEVSIDNTIENLRQRTSCYEEPFQGLSPNFTLFEIVSRNNVTVVLNGLGGDELFCGYNRHRIFRLWEILKRYHKIISFFPKLNKKVTKLKNISALKDFFQVYLYDFSIFSEIDKKELFEFNEAANWNSSKIFQNLYELDSLHFNDSIEAICYMDLLNYIGNHHVYRNDQFSMHFSLESRFPLLDHEIVELSCRIPSRFKVNNNVTKYILRRVAKDLIPSSCLAMRKKGFGLPLNRWMHSSSLQPIIRSKIKSLKKRGVFNNKKIDLLFNALLSGEDDGTKLLNIVSIELWIENLIEMRSSIS